MKRLGVGVGAALLVAFGFMLGWKAAELTDLPKNLNDG